MFPEITFEEIFNTIKQNLPSYALSEGQSIISIEPFSVKEKVLGLRRARSGFMIKMSDGGIHHLYHSFAGVFAPAKIGCYHDGPVQEYWFLGDPILSLQGGDMGPGYNGVKVDTFTKVTRTNVTSLSEFLGFEPMLYESAWSDF